MKPFYEMFLRNKIEQATNQAINMAVKNSTSTVSGMQSPFGVKPHIMQRMNSHIETNGRFKQS